jgi:hypothetical protein
MYDQHIFEKHTTLFRNVLPLRKKAICNMFTIAGNNNIVIKI